MGIRVVIRALPIVALAVAVSTPLRSEEGFKKHNYLQAYVSCSTWWQSREKFPALHEEVSRWVVEEMRASSSNKLEHLNDTVLLAATALECADKPGAALNKAVFSAILSVYRSRK